jgi:hypothetical protein
MKKKGTVRYPEFIGLRMEAELLQALGKAAVEEDRPLASLVRIAVREWLDAREKKAAKKKKPKAPR